MLYVQSGIHGVDRFYYLLPVATASTFTYLMPSASAANLMVYHFSDLKVADMVRIMLDMIFLQACHVKEKTLFE